MLLKIRVINILIISNLYYNRHIEFMLHNDTDVQNGELEVSGRASRRRSG